jgi:hypothetical protein
MYFGTNDWLYIELSKSDDRHGFEDTHGPPEFRPNLILTRHLAQRRWKPLSYPLDGKKWRSPTSPCCPR